jgi:hypothetical protein
MVSFENDKHPKPDRRDEIAVWARPALCAEADQVLEDYRAGKTAPLDLEKP